MMSKNYQTMVPECIFYAEYDPIIRFLISVEVFLLRVLFPPKLIQNWKKMYLSMSTSTVIKYQGVSIVNLKHPQ